MNQADLLKRVMEVLEELEITYLIVGSFASGAYGEPRLTQGIDIVIDITAEQISTLCEAFPFPDFYVNLEAAQEAVRQRRQFNVIHPASGNKIDFMISRNDAWGESQLARRQLVQVLPDHTGYVACPEDVILGKLLYYQEGGSEKHLRDISGIMRINPSLVDVDYLSKWAEQLGLSGVWEAVLSRLKNE